MATPLISILIPTYNVEAFVEQAIHSICNQTYTNLEIIIVDDCSTDQTYPILKKLAEKDSRIKLYRNTVNSKIATTLNTAFSYSSGEYIARMDGDDISVPNRIEQQLNFLLQHPEIDLLGLNYIVIDENNAEIKREAHISDPKKIIRAASYVSPIPHFWLAKRVVYEKIGPYRIPGVEDYDFLLRGLDLGFSMSNIQEYLYLHRIRGGNTATTTGLRQKKAFQYVKKLQAERKLNNKDSYTPENLENAIGSSEMEKKFFSISTKHHHSYILQKKTNKISSLFHLMIALVFSPNYLLREKITRFYYHKFLY